MKDEQVTSGGASWKIWFQFQKRQSEVWSSHYQQTSKVSDCKRWRECFIVATIMQHCQTTSWSYIGRQSEQPFCHFLVVVPFWTSWRIAIMHNWLLRWWASRGNKYLFGALRHPKHLCCVTKTNLVRHVTYTEQLFAFYFSAERALSAYYLNKGAGYSDVERCGSQNTNDKFTRKKRNRTLLTAQHNTT